MSIIYLDGKYLKVSPQIIEVFTPGVFKAKGVFETMLGLDGLVMDAASHLKRLRQGLKFLGLRSPAINPLILEKVLQRNRLSIARVRLMVWQSGKHIHLMVVALPYQFSSKPTYRVCLIKTKQKTNARMANVKSLDYEIFAQAYQQAQAQGFDEALLFNARGHIMEASRANIFWIKDQILYTPPVSCGCLNGITRQHVIKEAKSLKIPVIERDLTPKILRTADMAFLTNSLIGIKPIEL